jgi:hypothetical protein
MKQLAEFGVLSGSASISNLSFGSHEVNSRECPGDARQFCVSGCPVVATGSSYAATIANSTKRQLVTLPRDRA